MKKDRNCGGASYPIYPPYPPMGMMPNMMPMPYPAMPNQTNAGTSVSSNTIEQQLNSLEQRVNLLDRRVTTLENMFNNSSSSPYSNNYNSSNYQML